MMRNAFAVFGLSFLIIGTTLPTQAQNSSETYRQLNLFGDVFERVRQDYVEQVEDSKLIEAAINGMLSALDPHSGYLNAKSFQEMQVQTRGEFGGLGIEVTTENGFVKVISPIEGTPAYRAGILTGDFITHISGESTQGLTLNQAVERMRGPVNTDIKLTIARPGVERPFDVTLTREVIRIASVRARAEGDVAYVRINSFSEQTSSGLASEIEKLKNQIGKEIAGVVLDLRGNPGGLLDQAVRVSDAFLDQGEIVSTRGRRNGDSQRFNARDGDVAKGLPMVVLINGGSASASEIVAGALQDHGRAVIMGTQSFGKGSVQTIIPITGQGALRLTTSLYYTPSGRSIQAKGISPDIVVEPRPVAGVQAGPQRSEATLRNHIEVGPDGQRRLSPAQPADDQANRPPASQPAPTTPAEGAQPKAEGAPPEDPQLARALDLLRGLKLIAKKNSAN
ncbi:MAG: PDZ domain-containing protein [Alphaproteobacteria bacterium]|nr:PDZ domain-containing protein [Alphaproteobacteria bacterium]